MHSYCENFKFDRVFDGIVLSENVLELEKNIILNFQVTTKILFLSLMVECRIKSFLRLLMGRFHR